MCMYTYVFPTRNYPVYPVASWNRTPQLAETDGRLYPENAQSANVYTVLKRIYADWYSQQP